MPADDDIALARIRGICSHFAGAEEDVLQNRPLFHVGRRRFAIFNGEDSPPRPRWDGCGCSLHFLADPAEADALRADPRFTPSPHHGSRGWLMIRLRAHTDWDEIAELLDSAYRQVRPGSFDAS